MGPAREKPTMPLSKVPSVKELYEKLGFRHATPRELNGFQDICHAFRKTYRTLDGTPGNELTDWNLAKVQDELYIMATMFLDDAKNGVRFWSDSTPWMEDGNLHYPKDKPLIASILKQLFWKQNKYADNNQRYAEKKNRETSQEEYRDISASGLGTPTINFRALQALPCSSTETTVREVQPTDPIIVLTDEERDISLVRMESVISSNANSQKHDIFDVPIDANENRQAAIPLTVRANVVPRTLRNNSSSQSTKVGKEKQRVEKPSPRKAKISLRNKSKVVSKRPLESPSSASKRRRMSSDYSRHLFGEEAEAALDEYNMEETARRGRHDKKQEEGGEQNREQVDENDLLDLHQLLSNPTGVSLSQSPKSLNRPPQREQVDYSLNSLNTGYATHTVNDMSSSCFVPPIAQMTEDAGLVSRALPTPPTQSPLEGQEKPNNSDISDQLVKSKTRVNGSFWIMVNRYPNRMVRRHWKNGQFKGKTLSTVLDEISSFIDSGPIEEIDLKLETFLDETLVTLYKDDENLWKETQRDFQKQIKDAFTKDNARGSQYKIQIKPIYAENVAAAYIDASKNEDSEDFEGDLIGI